MAAERRGTDGSAVVNVKGFRRLDGRYPPDTPPRFPSLKPRPPPAGAFHLCMAGPCLATGTL
jgi:hypothetical protein